MSILLAQNYVQQFAKLLFTVTMHICTLRLPASTCKLQHLRIVRFPKIKSTARMSLEKLRSIYQSIDTLEMLNSCLSAKIAAAEKERLKEESAYNLLKYELSQLTKSLQDDRLEMEKLKKRRDSLEKSHRDITRSSISFKNYSMINAIRLEMKAHSMEKVQQKLDALDFDNEARECDPSQAFI